jgi:hypothetical protein
MKMPVARGFARTLRAFLYWELTIDNKVIIFNYFELESFGNCCEVLPALCTDNGEQ